LITADGSDFIIGNGYNKISLRDIENRVRNNQYVSTTQAFKDLAGNLTIEVSLNKPVARILRKDGSDSYLCESGKVITTSEKYTSRVLLISGDFMKDVTAGNIASDSIFGNVFELVDFIRKDAFWEAQIAQLHIHGSGDITIYPQVTKQYIEFGKAEHIEAKFLKLRYFYTKILPFKGWNHYARVNVEFANQIICE
jgi:cell division protein FtsQ